MCFLTRIHHKPTKIWDPKLSNFYNELYASNLHFYVEDPIFPWVCNSVLWNIADICWVGMGGKWTMEAYLLFEWIKKVWHYLLMLRLFSTQILLFALSLLLGFGIKLMTRSNLSGKVLNVFIYLMAKKLNHWSKGESTSFPGWSLSFASLVDKGENLWLRLCLSECEIRDIKLERWQLIIIES